MNWTRECQACGRKNERTAPPPKSASKMTYWENMPCKFCRSESLDFGYDADLRDLIVDEEEDEA